MKNLKYPSFRDFQKMNLSIQKLFWEKEYSSYNHFLNEKGNDFVKKMNEYFKQNNFDTNKIDNYIHNILFLGFKNHQKERAIKIILEKNDWIVTPTNDFENTVLKIDLKAFKNGKWMYIQVKPNETYKPDKNEFKRLIDYIQKLDQNAIAVLSWINDDKLYLKKI
ncbi:hypothetical protein AAW50_03550 [Mycoplasmopsis canis]|uniref:hypothetical protein n=1 Tax=Mycoplasmopsis canis TaxID=29555 RepID=UPI0006247949|nr:hypothetical protein [Mycoplasmopsis canis]AKF41464.1 hypothetical protein AAW50_03550 [Mycoplasmopsis canis]